MVYEVRSFMMLNNGDDWWFNHAWPMSVAGEWYLKMVEDGFGGVFALSIRNIKSPCCLMTLICGWCSTLVPDILRMGKKHTWKHQAGTIGWQISMTVGSTPVACYLDWLKTCIHTDHNTTHHTSTNGYLLCGLFQGFNIRAHGKW